MATNVLTDPKRIRSDCVMLMKAIKERWPMPDKSLIIERLVKIMNKETVTTCSATGEIVESEATADRNATSACKVLLALEAQNQADEHHEDGSTMNHVHSVERRNAELSVVSAELGIDPSIIGLPESDANSGTRTAKELSAE